GNSFLVNSLGRQMFSKGLTVLDEPIRPGETGSKLFDGEGVACKNSEVIAAGSVKRYSVNTYMAGKMGIEPTIEDVLRPRLAPWPTPGLDRNALMKMCGDGILVTDFNGGNCNMTTGDFSYGISGQLFKDGVCVRPVSEMLITDNFLQLWKNLIAAGEDYRICSSKLIPSLAFDNVDFSG
ncbi:MAG: TldD/PmbA family protein, partial [Bacteroidales bacterium]|nr:TldD/PmbA family protein [Bacteroidales bacterium]